jgi:hypothetical protein
MSEYRMRETATTSTIIPETEVQGRPSYMSIPDKYGIDDMVIGIGTGNSDQNQATIDQEYRSYVTPPYSMQSSDPLKFWEVGALMLVEHY